MINGLISTANAVIDERSFVRLLQLMALDRQHEEQKELAAPGPPYAAGARGWENGDVAAFLNAAAAWAEDTQHTSNLDAGPSDIWRRAAKIIVAGAFYE